MLVDDDDTLELESVPQLHEPDYCSLFEHLSVGVFQSTADGKIVAANPALARNVSDISELFEVEPRRRREFRRLLAKGSVPRFEVQIDRADQSTIWISINAQPMRDADGKVLFYQGTVEDISERRAAEQALQEQLHFTKQLLQAIPGPVFFKDETGRYLGCNQAFADYIGIGRDELIGRTVYDIAPRDLALQYAAADEALFKNPGNHVYESSVRYADGTRHEVVFYKATFSKTDGRVGGLVGVMLDISERKRVEVQLKRRADEFASLYEVSHDLATPMDTQTLLKRINDRACELLRTRTPLIVNDYQNWEHRLTTYADIGVTSAMMVPMLFAGDLIGVLGVSTVGIMRQFTEDDEHLLSLFAAQAAGAVRNARLLEETLRRAEALAQSEERLRAILDHATAVVYVVDREQRYTFVNRQREKLFRHSRREVAGRTTQELLPKPIAAAAEESHRAVFASGSAVELEELVSEEDGPHSYLSLKFPLFDADGNAYAVCGISTDITQRVRDEAAIRELNETLERRVTERTQEWQRANSELAAFSYSVSHDLRAPLRAVAGFSHVLEEEFGEQLAAQGQAYLMRIRNAIRRMELLIDALLGLARLSRHELRVSALDLSRLVAGLCDELVAGEPGREVSLAIASGVAAQGDPTLMRVALQNLLDNAWKYTARRADARIEFGAAHTETGERAYFVRDNGSGFDMAYRDKLFEPFQRLHSDQDFVGTGIGLTSVQRVVSRHGGRVWGEGAGTRGDILFHALRGARRAQRAGPEIGPVTGGVRHFCNMQGAAQACFASYICAGPASRVT